MPIYDIKCNDCGAAGEVLVTSSSDALTCPQCNSANTEKLMSKTSSLTGQGGQGFPGPGDHGCCGSHPGAAGCAGPGSCCGRGGM